MDWNDLDPGILAELKSCREEAEVSKQGEENGRLAGIDLTMQERCDNRKV